ncbi:MAG: TatD family hydrolase [Flavobacteriia bacterium]|jgi:TatD DNase family protein
MNFIDTHTHLFSDSFNEDRAEAVTRAINAGVQTLLLPNIDLESIQPMHDLVAQFPNHCYPMMGLHPGAVEGDWINALEIIKGYLFSDKSYCAVGEIGMDLYWDKSFINEQREAFQQQVEWAKELKLPIVIHAREAFDEIFEVLDVLNDDSLSGVFHCFTGTLEQAHRALDYGGFKLGIGGVLTYKKSGLDEVLTHLPLDCMILETDSPYLPPVPHRGKRNESAYLLHVAERLAEVKKVTLKQVEDITSQNARSLFHV